MKLFKLVVDFAHEGGIHWALALLRFAKEYGVAVKLVNEVGPGGGWPEVVLVGTHAQLVAVCRVRAGSDDALAVEESERIEEFSVPHVELRDVTHVSALDDAAAARISFEVWRDGAKVGLGDMWLAGGDEGDVGGSGAWLEDDDVRDDIFDDVIELVNKAWEITDLTKSGPVARVVSAKGYER